MSSRSSLNWLVDLAVRHSNPNIPQQKTMSRRIYSMIVLLLVGFCCTPMCLGQVREIPPNHKASAPKKEAESQVSLPNLKTPTLGGKQFWTDHAWRNGWRIQHNVLTDHWRVIDADNIRHGWGKRSACQEILDEQVPTPETRQRTVILLHGLGRSSVSMHSLSSYLVERMDCTTIAFEYASTRASVASHAEALREVLSGLPKETELDFIGHSLGNIVVRYAIGDLQRAGDTATLARIRHVVMLGPPNQGSAIARYLSNVGLFEWITGKSGQQLGAKWEEFEAHLATPPCPFGIIAGNLPESLPKNPLVDGPSDFVVSVEETKLAGAADFLEVPRLHSFLMDDPNVQHAVERFLATETFK